MARASLSAIMYGMRAEQEKAERKEQLKNKVKVKVKNKVKTDENMRPRLLQLQI